MASPPRKSEHGGFSKFLHVVFGPDSDDDNMGGSVDSSIVALEAGLAIPVELSSNPKNSRSNSSDSCPEENVIAKVSKQVEKIPPVSEDRGKKVPAAAKASPPEKYNPDIHELSDRLMHQQGIIDGLSKTILKYEEEHKAALSEQRKHGQLLYRLLLKLKDEVPMTSESGPLRATLQELGQLVLKPETDDLPKTLDVSNETHVLGTTAYHQNLFKQMERLSLYLTLHASPCEEVVLQCKALLTVLIQNPEQAPTTDLTKHTSIYLLKKKKLAKILEFLKQLHPLVAKELERLGIEVKKTKELTDHERIRQCHTTLTEEWNSIVYEIYKFKIQLDCIDLIYDSFLPILDNFHQSRKLINDIHSLHQSVKGCIVCDGWTRKAQNQSAAFDAFQASMTTLKGPCSIAVRKLNSLINAASDMLLNQEFQGYLAPVIDPTNYQDEASDASKDPAGHMTLLDKTFQEEIYSALKYLLLNFHNHIARINRSSKPLIDLVHHDIGVHQTLIRLKIDAEELLKRIRGEVAPVEKAEEASALKPDEEDAYSALCTAVEVQCEMVMARIKALGHKQVVINEQDLLKDDDSPAIASLDQCIEDWKKIIEREAHEQSRHLLEAWLNVNFLLYDIKQELGLKEYKDDEPKLKNFIFECEKNLKVSQDLVTAISTCIQKLDAKEGFTAAEQDLIRGFLANLDGMKGPFSELNARSAAIQGDLGRKLENLSSFLILKLQQESEDMKRFGIDSRHQAAMALVTEGLQKRLNDAFERKKSIFQEMINLFNTALCKLLQLQDDIEFSRMSITTPVEIKNLKTHLSLLQADADGLIKDGSKLSVSQLKEKAAEICLRYKGLTGKMDEYKNFYESYSKFADSGEWVKKLHERSSCFLNNEFTSDDKAKAELSRNQSQMVLKLQAHHKDLREVWNALSTLKTGLEPKIKTLTTVAETGAFPSSRWW